MNDNKLIKCPVVGCLNYRTSSARNNLAQHIRKQAASELLRRHLLERGEIHHAKWLKEHLTVATVQVFKIDKHTFTLLQEKGQ